MSSERAWVRTFDTTTWSVEQAVAAKRGTSVALNVASRPAVASLAHL